MNSSSIDWLFWRPIVKGVATLEEIETHWDLTDLLDANEALDVMDDLERLQAKKTEQKSNSGWK